MYFNESKIREVLLSKELINKINKKNINEVEIILIVQKLLSDNQLYIGYDGILVDAFISKNEIGVNVEFTSTGALLSKLNNDGYEDQDQMPTHPNINPSINPKSILNKTVNLELLRERLPNCIITGYNAFFNSRLIIRSIRKQEWRVHITKSPYQAKINKKVIQ